MFTIKQLEAFYWTATLRGFGRASEQLHTTQSTISKRIAELEDFLNCSLFDVSSKRTSLTTKGVELLEECDELLKCSDRIIARFKNDTTAIQRIKIGITELTATTWFPTFISLSRKLRPNLILDPIVDSSDSLLENLKTDRIDYVIVPDMEKKDAPNGFYIGTSVSSWICGASQDSRDDTRGAENLQRFTLITEERTSRVGSYFEDWMRKHNIKFDNTVYCNNLIATASLILGGGQFISNSLNAECYAQHIQEGRMKIIHGLHPPPDIEYFSYTKSRTQEFDYLNSLARSNCNFTKRVI